EQDEAGRAWRAQETGERRWPLSPGVRGPGAQASQGLPDTTGASVSSPLIPGVRGPGSLPEDQRNLAAIVGEVISEFLTRAFPSPYQSAQQLQSILPSMAAEGVAPFAQGGSALGEAIQRRLAAMAGTGDQ